jgi:hypothetical protein
MPEEKAEKCGIAGCEKPAERSVSKQAVEKAGMKMANEDARRAHLCKDHYRQYKKTTKTDRKLEWLGR